MQNQETSILIVEDDPDILSILSNIFTKHFNIIYTATNGKLALSVVKELNPDLILTDIQMPEINGIEFVTKMRAEGKAIPVVMISSSQDRQFLLKAIKLGVQDFVEKPFKKWDIEMAVHRVLEMAVRSNDLTNLIFLFGIESKEVKRQKKLIGLLQAISTQR
jgi:YesN/AraC family two-component response regulator